MGIDSWEALMVGDEEKLSFHGNNLLNFLKKALVPWFPDHHPTRFSGSLSTYKPENIEDVFGFDRKGGGEKEEDEKVVCVTSAASYLGVAIVKHLLALGYSVCALLDKHDNEERLREMVGMRGEKIEIRCVSLTEDDGDDLYDAFNGCRGVFHTSSSIDPSALSGYSKTMAELEVKATVNVIKTCTRVPSITKCVLTSSLASCIWQDESSTQIINHNSWSQDSTCIDKKLWFALGKLRAEREAWRIAQESPLKLATLCPALIIGPDYTGKNPTPTFAYLKGGQEMYAKGMLATVDVTRLARAHINVYEAMNATNACGRYVCFDRVISSEAEAQRLSEETGVIIHGDERVNPRVQYRLSNAEMNNILLSRLNRCCSNRSYKR